MKKKKESKCKTFVLKYHIINNLIVSNYELTIRIYIMEKKNHFRHTPSLWKLGPDKPTKKIMIYLKQHSEEMVVGIPL